MRKDGRVSGPHAGVPMHVGIDVSKTEVVVAVEPSGEVWTSPTTTVGLRALTKRLGKLQPTLVVLEPTGGYEVPVVDALLGADLPTALVHPGRVRDYAKSQGQRAKTDVLDARLLAQYAAQWKDAHPLVLDPAQRILLRVVLRRQQLEKMLTAERLRLDQDALYPDSVVRADLQEHVAYLEAKLHDVDHELTAMIQAQPTWAATAALLRTVPGVGKVTAAILLACVPELGTLSRHKIAALIGLAPLARESGRWKGQRHIVGGRALVRRVLYMAAFSASRWNPSLRAFYQRLVTKGKTHKQAVTACMRKLLVLLNSMMKSRQPWRDTAAATA